MDKNNQQVVVTFALAQQATDLAIEKITEEYGLMFSYFMDGENHVITDEECLAKIEEQEALIAYYKKIIRKGLQAQCFCEQILKDIPKPDFDLDGEENE